MKNTTEKELDALVPLPLIHSIHEGLWSYEGTRLVMSQRSSEDSVVIYRKFYRKSLTWLNMPPDGYTTVTISDNVATKLTQIMANHDHSNYAEAIEYAADTTLLQENEITVQELIQLLAKRVDEMDETSLP